MTLEARLRRLEEIPTSDPEMAALDEWAGSIGIENLRALRDHLKRAAVDENHDFTGVWADQGLRTALESAPPSSRQLFLGASM